MAQHNQQITPPTNYTVQAGDTLSGIAQRAYGNGSQPYWMALYIVNQNVVGNNPNLIRPGENLDIPAIVENPTGYSLYIVKPGDTLYGIAERVENGLEVQSWVETIYTTNQQEIGNNPNLIRPGQVLFIPAGGGGGLDH